MCAKPPDPLTDQNEKPIEPPHPVSPPSRAKVLFKTFSIPVVAVALFALLVSCIIQNDWFPAFRHLYPDETDTKEKDDDAIVISGTHSSCLSQTGLDRSTAVVHISIVACHDRYEDAIVSMKSAVIATNSHLFFHIFTDEKHIQKKTFQRHLEIWPAVSHGWTKFAVYPIQYPDVPNKIDWLHLFKPCASQRLFLPTILQHIDALIYVDTDTLFLEAPEKLWDAFDRFDTVQIAGMVPECEQGMEYCHYNSSRLQHPYVEPHGLNSGVMLMNLTRMRDLHWDADLIGIHTKYGEKMIYGDQDILNVYFQQHRYLVYFLSCVWNYRSDHCMHGNTCAEAAVGDDFVGGVSLLHGNRQVFKYSHLQPEFYAMYTTFRVYDFTEDFQKAVVATLRKTFISEEYVTSLCGKMGDAFLKHILCAL